MNLQEFAALRVGDKISNPMSQSTGEIVDTTDAGVYVRWGTAVQPFFFNVRSTAWMHWTKQEAETS
jgi:hypothetical protein